MLLVVTTITQCELPLVLVHAAYQMAESYPQPVTQPVTQLVLMRATCQTLKAKASPTVGQQVVLMHASHKKFYHASPQNYPHSVLCHRLY